MAPGLNGVYRAPATYPISSRPVRIAGSQDAPFRIINLSVDNPVWVSNNPGISGGQGTPISPGTSLQWLNPTELWAVCDSGLTASIIVTTEIDDWQPDPVAIATAILNSGVIVVDNPTTLPP